MLDCYKIARFTNGGSPVERLINLPLDQLFSEIEIVNKAAEQEKRILESA